MTNSNQKPPFATSHQPLPSSRRSRRRQQTYFSLRNIRLSFKKIVIGLVCLMIVLSITIAALILDASNNLRFSQARFSRVVDSLDTNDQHLWLQDDMERLQTSLAELEHQLSVAKSRVGWVAPMAKLHPESAAALEMLNAAHELSLAGITMLQGVQPAAQFLTIEHDSSQFVAGNRIAELLANSSASFEIADGYLTQAQERVAGIPLQSLSPELLLQREQLWGYLEQARHLNAILQQSPETINTLLGVYDTQSYLVLSQNNDEIRPSGGFISTYGWFTMRDGQIRDFGYRPSTITSPNPPNEQFGDTITVPDWWLTYNDPVFAAWDGSWSADFPMTAAMAIDYYNVGNNRYAPIQAAIAIDVTGFELLVGALGDIDVPEYDVTITSENFRDLVYAERAFGSYGDGVKPHKEFLSEIYSAIFDAWQNVDSETSNAVLGAMIQGLSQRHVMIYSTTPEVNAALDILGWSGGLNTGIGHDYLMVADANIAGNKVNNSVQRHWTYDVQLNPSGSVDSRLTVQYDYPGSALENDPAVDLRYHGPVDFYNLMQVIVPPRVQLDYSMNVARVVTESTDTYTSFIARHNVLLDSSERLQYHYSVPDVVESIGEYRRYQLYVQKQPGARNHDVTVQITLPEGASIVSASPDVNAVYTTPQTIIEHQVTLTNNTWIEVIYQISE